MRYLGTKSAHVLVSCVLLIFSTLTISAMPQKSAHLPITSLNLGDTNADLVYTPLPPCRIVDTRSVGGAIAGGTSRNFLVAGTTGFTLQGGTSGGCGVPTTATAALLNFVAVTPDGVGNLKGSAFPNPIPTTGSIINYQLLNPALNIANAAAFPICDRSVSTCDADITLFANGGGTNVVIDVLGYFRRFPKEQTITSIIPGPGLTGGGTAGDVTLSVNFAGTGTATTAARSDHTHYVRTIIVSPTGTPAQNGTALLNAIAGITTASVSNPFMLKAEPGIYDVGTSSFVMKPYVDVEGSGELTTKITRAGSTASTDSTVVAADNAEIRDLTIENTGGSAAAIALQGLTSGVHARNVTVSVTGTASAVAIGVGLFAASTEGDLRDVMINMETGGAATGNGVLASPLTAGRITVFLDRVDATIGVDTADNVIGAAFINADGLIRNSRINSFGGAVMNYGVTQQNSTVLVRTSLVAGNAVGAQGSTGLTADGTSAFRCEYSSIAGATNTVTASAGGVVRVTNSRMQGGPVAGPGTITCGLVTDQAGTGFLNTCP